MKNAHAILTKTVGLLLLAAAITIITLAATKPLLTSKKPQETSPTYQILEPETWTGKKLPIIKYINIKNKIKNGNWLLLFYHHDCPDCRKAIPRYEEIARILKDSKDFLRIAFIEVPPYFHNPITESSPCLLGRLNEDKQWFITTPAVTIISEGKVISAWEAKAPDLDTIMQKLSEKRHKNFLNSQIFSQHLLILPRYAQ